jgi:hypothetical protein
LNFRFQSKDASVALKFAVVQWTAEIRPTELVPIVEEADLLDKFLNRGLPNLLHSPSPGYPVACGGELPENLLSFYLISSV